MRTKNEFNLANHFRIRTEFGLRIFSEFGKRTKFEFAANSICVLWKNSILRIISEFSANSETELFRIFLKFEKRTKFEFAANSICAFPANAQCDLEVYIRKSFTISQMARWSSGDDKVLISLQLVVRIPIKVTKPNTGKKVK